MKILIASDGSEHSELALDDTIQQSWPSGSEFRIVSIVDNSFIPSSANDKQTVRAQSVVDSAVAKMRAALGSSCTIEGQVLQGYPKSELAKIAESSKCDLLIVGSRGLKGIKRVVLGSVSHSLLVAVPCSIRIVRRSPKTESQKVLVSLDTSDESQLVINRVASRSWPNGTQFLCVTAVPSLKQFFYEKQDSHEITSLENLRREQVKLALSRLEQEVQLLRSKLPHVSATFEVVDGDPREAVLEKADEWQANLIMLGSKGKNWLDRVLIGSVSEAIATWADCSVEVIK